MASAEPTPSPTIEVPEEGLRKTRNAGLFINVVTFLIGYATAVIAGALLYIKGDFKLNEAQQGLATSVVLLGAMVGALGSGRVSDRAGRKVTLLVGAILFTAGLALAARAPGYGVLLVTRVLQGLGVGAASALVPTYLSEISPAQIRGRMLTLNQLLQTVGMLAAYIVNLVFSDSGDWRACSGLCSGLAWSRRSCSPSGPCGSPSRRRGSSGRAGPTTPTTCSRRSPVRRAPTV